MSKKRPRGRPKESDVPKAVLHVEVPRDLKEEIEALAERNERKITGEVIRALKEHIARSKARATEDADE